MSYIICVHCLILIGFNIISVKHFFENQNNVYPKRVALMLLQRY
jgi:hypothetical protein